MKKLLLLFFLRVASPHMVEPSTAIGYNTSVIVISDAGFEHNLIPRNTNTFNAGEFEDINFRNVAFFILNSCNVGIIYSYPCGSINDEVADFLSIIRKNPAKNTIHLIMRGMFLLKVLKHRDEEVKSIVYNAFNELFVEQTNHRCDKIIERFFDSINDFSASNYNDNLLSHLSIQIYEELKKDCSFYKEFGYFYVQSYLILLEAKLPFYISSSLIFSLSFILPFTFFLAPKVAFIDYNGTIATKNKPGVVLKKTVDVSLNILMHQLFVYYGYNYFFNIRSRDSDGLHLYTDAALVFLHFLYKTKDYCFLPNTHRLAYLPNVQRSFFSFTFFIFLSILPLAHFALKKS